MSALNNTLDKIVISLSGLTDKMQNLNSDLSGYVKFTDVKGIVTEIVNTIVQNTWGAFTINGQRYDTLSAAIYSQQIGTLVNIKLMADTETPAFNTISGCNIEIDLNGNDLNICGPMTGSSGTTTNAFQFLKDSTVTFKNGKITADSNKVKILIQNYCNLTLDNVKIYIDNTFDNKICKKYALSNNFGNIIIKNGTEIHSIGTSVAFDLYYGMDPIYDEGVYVTIETEDVIIDGPIEYAKDSRITDPNWMNYCILKVHKNVQINPPEGYKFELIDDTYKKLVVK